MRRRAECEGSRVTETSTNVAFFSGLLQTVADRGRALVRYRRAAPASVERVVASAGKLLTGRGEASGMALAAAILADYSALGPAQRLEFLATAASRFGPDLDALAEAARAFLADPDDRTAAALREKAEPRRQELLRRLNHAPGATLALVRMREDMIEASQGNPALAALDADFVHLFASWFNRGFLVLRRIDWTTPANILDKIIRYEAVHAIHGWDDEPLIFVEVALTDSIPAAIAPLLAPDRVELAPHSATTAVFYSISNAQRGLSRVSFGNFLIKQVVEELKREWPRLTNFVTLSPVPGFAAWLAREGADGASSAISAPARRALALLDRPNWWTKAAARAVLERVLVPLAAHYFLVARTPSGRIVDPVARFHLGNGARLERIDPFGDLSQTALGQSHGLMVNYLYDLDEIEENHEAFANKNEVVASQAVRKLARARLRESAQDSPASRSAES
jgi:malonyl-CoA decarboxylase